MAAEFQINRTRIGDWLSTETEFDWIKARLIDAPSSGLSAWARTTSGIVALLITLQFLTGLLLAFHYVPSIGNAYTTVAYIELAVRDGAWIRSLHYHSSVMLPIALGLHLLQMIVRSAYSGNGVAWTLGLVLLGLTLAAGATGYALPWDARSVNGVNIAASLVGNAPVFGEAARTWLINGAAISTLTLSRFYALHVWIVPVLILAAVTARVFLFGRKNANTDSREMSAWARHQFARNMIVIGITFLGLSVFSIAYPAPFGPQAAESATYLPRPGPQFLWLFEMQKYTDGPLAAVLATGFPALIIGGLIALPLFLKRSVQLRRIAVSALFVIGFGIVAILTAIAVYQDVSDPRISEQLAKQELDEAKFRQSAFEPQLQGKPGPPPASHASDTDESSIETASAGPMAVPESYTTSCAKCHGANGEGTKKFPELIGITTREEDTITPELALAIINDPKSVGRSSKMPAYHDKLSETEKQEIVSWIRSLSPWTESDGVRVVQTARVEENK